MPLIYRFARAADTFSSNSSIQIKSALCQHIGRKESAVPPNFTPVAAMICAAKSINQQTDIFMPINGANRTGISPCQLQSEGLSRPVSNSFQPKDCSLLSHISPRPPSFSTPFFSCVQPTWTFAAKCRGKLSKKFTQDLIIHYYNTHTGACQAYFIWFLPFIHT